MEKKKRNVKPKKREKMKKKYGKKKTKRRACSVEKGTILSLRLLEYLLI
jgi:hypothetical protein